MTYDAIGNPLTYYNGQSYNFTWKGRQLIGATYGGKTMSFTYNDNGIRTSKTVAGTKTTYYLDGDRIVAEETNGNVIVYIYDENGLPLGMQYHGASYAKNTWDIYWFEKNLFGDIISVRSNTGTLLVQYKYNAYGECTVTYSNSGDSTTATLNPFRYRGYYFDKDLNLYYVNARYYDSVIGRWISPDEMMSGVNGSLNGFNLYVYCFDNPINMIDSSGNWPKWIEDAVDWIGEQYNTWKEASFVRNVVVKNISADFGVGIGVGGEVEVGPVKLSAISRVDVFGIEVNGLEADVGYHGKSAIHAGLGEHSIGVESKTFETYDGNQYRTTKNVPDVGWSKGIEVGFVISFHVNVSVSYSGMYSDFVEYVRKRGWWK